MADNNDIKPYPFNFDPSQWSNKYSPYAGKAIPFPSQYRGTPTDAHGNPIQSYVDTQKAHDAWAAANPAPAPVAAPTTINSIPQFLPVGLEQGGGNAHNYDQTAGQLTGGGYQVNPAYAIQQMQQQGSQVAPPGSSPGTQALYGRNFGAFYGGQQPQPQQAPPAAAPSNPYDMNQAYLDALSSPGHVATPGATVAQAAPPSANSGVLQQFLANWGGNSKGAGNYDNSGFINSLRGMV